MKVENIEDEHGSKGYDVRYDSKRVEGTRSVG